MRNGRIRIRSGIFVIALFAISACADSERRHGYAPSDDELEAIAVGIDDKTTVEDAVGQPSASGVVSDDAWYYVESTFDIYGFRGTREVERQVVAISFDDSGTVENIERFGMEDGQLIALSRRVTGEEIGRVSFLRQLLGNFGNIDAANILER